MPPRIPKSKPPTPVVIPDNISVPWDTVDENFTEEQFYTSAGYGGGEQFRLRISIADMQVIRTVVQSEKFDKLKEIGDVIRHYVHIGNAVMLKHIDDPKWMAAVRKHDRSLRQMRAMQKAADEEHGYAVFGEVLRSIQQMVDDIRKHGDEVRAQEMIRAQWRFIEGLDEPYWQAIWREKFRAIWPEFKP